MTAIRYHLDENVASAIADGLRRRGIDVTTTSDVGLIGAGDDAHLAFAAAEQRVVFTHDDDFLGIAQRGIQHCGITILPSASPHDRPDHQQSAPHLRLLDRRRNAQSHRIPLSRFAAILIVPTLCVGTHWPDALRRRLLPLHQIAA